MTAGPENKPRLLVVADYGVPTGFARVSMNLLPFLHATWDVHVCGINWLGDCVTAPPFPVYAASLGGDPWGIGRYRSLVEQIQPAVVLLIHDPWIIARFVAEHEKLPAWPVAERPPLVAYMPIDGYNVAEAPALNTLALAIVYTPFGAQELKRGGYVGPMTVIPHGVNLDIYRPHDQGEARERLGVPELNAPGTIVIGNMNRNQPRKRLDLTLLGFAEWLTTAETPERAFLWLHCAEQDIGGNLRHLARYLGIEGHVLFPPEPLTTFRGAPEEELPWVYSAWDVQVSTTQGEGWGLGVMEAMACGIPNLVPRWSALAEWANGGVAYMLCSTVAVNEHSVLGGVVTPGTVARALNGLVRDTEGRAELARDGWALVQRPQFRWEHIAQRFDTALRLTMEGRAYEVPKHEEMATAVP